MSLRDKMLFMPCVGYVLDDTDNENIALATTFLLSFNNEAYRSVYYCSKMGNKLQRKSRKGKTKPTSELLALRQRTEGMGDLHEGALCKQHV